MSAEQTSNLGRSGNGDGISQRLPKPGKFLTFGLGEQRFGVPIGIVREINRVSTITPVPQTLDFVVGVINLRGKVIPVVDLRLKLGVPAIAFTRATCIIVLEIGSSQVGIIVDSVKEVTDFLQGNIDPPPTLTTSPARGAAGDAASAGLLSTPPAVCGIGKEEDRMTLLLDLEDALSAEKLLKKADEEKLKAA